MGLLDTLGNLNPDQAQGLLAAASGILQNAGPTRSFGLGQAFGVGASAFQGSMQDAQRRKQEEEQMRQLAAMRAQQMQMGQFDLARQQRGEQEEIDMQSAYREAGNDPQKLVDAVSRANPMKGFGLRQQLAPKPVEYDTTVRVGVGADGKPVQYVMGKDGQPKMIDGIAPRDPLKFLNLNGKTVGVDEFTGNQGAVFQHSQSPDSVASQSSAAASRAQSDRHFNASFGLARQEAATRAGALQAGPKMTEDQGKATGWLIQAENAYKNMMAVGIDKQGNPTSAAMPGFNDALGSVPLMGGVANTFRSADRQKFMHATSSLSESLLRAATGAGVNKEEAQQKIAELTPQFGEAPDVTKQKYAAIPLYINSLKVRAGPGASLAAGVLNGPAAPASAGGWSIKKVQ